MNDIANFTNNTSSKIRWTLEHMLNAQSHEVLEQAQ